MNGRLTRSAPCGAHARLDAAARRRVVRLAELERASGRGTDGSCASLAPSPISPGTRRSASDHLDEAAWFRSPGVPRR